MMKKTQKLLIATTLLPFYLFADCQQMLDSIEQARKKNQPYIQHLATATDKMCLGGKKGEKMKRNLLKIWAEQTFAKVLAGEPARFDKAQRQRLKRFNTEIQLVDRLIINKQMDWLPALLTQLADSSSQSNQALSMYLQPIFDGYLNDAEKNKLSNVVKKARLDRFIASLDQALSVKNTTDKSMTTRAFGDPPQIRYMKMKMEMDKMGSRGANFGSSASEDAPNSLTTPIRFQFNSTKLNKRGEEEFTSLLKLLVENNTDSVFLIGHASPKGSDSSNCDLSMRRVKALRQKVIESTDISDDRIHIAWAGERIPLNFEQAEGYLQNRDIKVDAPNNDGDDSERRRVEIEVNGQLLRERYAGKFCQ